MADKLHLHLFGSPQILWQDKALDGFVSNKARALLIFLAVTGRSHSRDALAELLWADTPSSRRANLKRALSNLRGLDGIVLLEEGQHLVALDSHHTWVDVVEFTQLASEATPGDMASLQRAAQLCQGEFLAGFPLSISYEFEAWVLSEQARLNEQLVALLRRLAAECARRDKLPQAIATMRRLLQLEPWREEAHRQLMTFLARSGDRSAALKQFELCCEILAAELNVEPGPLTVELATQIRAGTFAGVDDQVPAPVVLPAGNQVASALQHNLPAPTTPLIGRQQELADQKLLLTAGYGNGQVIANQSPAQLMHSPVPLQRPPRPEHFVEREAELHQLLTDLQPGQVITLCGPGGIGKSTLAAQVVWQLAPTVQAPVQFPDGIIFYSFYNQGAVELALQHIALSFGEDLQPTPILAAQRALAGKHALLILDGAEQADDLAAVLDIRDRCGVLVTSRRHSDAVTTWHDLSPLTPKGASALLRAWGRQRAGEDTLVSAICELLGYLPLAIRLVGRYLAEREEEASAYLAWLEATPLAALDQGQRQRDSVPLLLERSVGQVSQAAQQALGVVGLLALAPFEPGTITAALPQVADDQRSHREKQRPSAIPSSSWVHQALGELVNYGLLRRRHQLYEVTHALVHTYARERLAPPDETLAHLIGYYTAFSHIQKEQGAEGFAGLALARPHLVALVHRGLERETWAAVITLAQAIDDYLDLQGYWLDRITVLQAGLTAAKMLQERQEEGIYLGHLGSMYEALGQYQVAIEHYEQALVISRERGDCSHESAWLGSLGGVYAMLGQYQMAIEYNEQALLIAREIGDRHGEGIRLGYLGTFYADLGQYSRAIGYRQQALAITREIGDYRGESIHLGNLGRMYLTLGRYQEAIDYMEQALAITREIGDRRREGVRLGHLGRAYSALRQYLRAIGYYEQALTIAREIGDRRREGIWLGSLGDVYTEIRQGQVAIEYNEQALLITREIGDRREEGDRLSHFGSMYHTLGQYKQAILYMEQGLQIAHEIGDAYHEALKLYDLGVVYSDLAQVAQARQCWVQSLRIFEQLKSPHAEAVRGRLAPLQAEE